VIQVTGLGPGDFDRNPGPVRDLLLDAGKQLIIRTRDHPAAAQLESLRDNVVFCDDLYESQESFEAVYSAIATRVIEAAELGPVVYAVPGAATIGEFAVREILSRRADVEVVPTESFVDAVLREVGYDPFDRGLQILNGHHLVDPVVIDKPTIVGHLDRPEVLADVAARLSRVLPETAEVTVLAGVGASDAVVWTGSLDEVESSLAGVRTSLWIDTEPGGIIGAIRTMERLRAECPWDREQTHESLTKNLIEECFELIDAIAVLGPGGEIVDWVAYSGVEEELGDVLLQVLFHAAIAREAGAFDIDDAAETLRQKLVRRHPHVFAGVEVAGAAEVKENWDQIKREEKPGERPSALDGVPPGMPALHLASKLQNRAAKAGFELPSPLDQVKTLLGDLELVSEQLDDPIPAGETLGDLLFTLVSLSRRAGVDAEVALRRAAARFESSFRAAEADALADQTSD